MPRRLKDILGKEVSLVDFPANERPFLLFKALESKAAEDLTAEDRELVGKALEVTLALDEAGLLDVAKDLSGADPVYAAAVLEAATEAEVDAERQARIRYAMRILGQDLAWMPKEVVMALAHAADLDDEIAEEVQKIATAKAAAMKCEKCDATVAKDATECPNGHAMPARTNTEKTMPNEEIEKAMQAEREERQKAIDAAVAEERGKRETVEKTLKAERDLRLNREWTEKAKSIAIVPGDLEKTAGMLRKIYDVSPELADEVFGSLKSAATAARAAIFKDIGVVAEPDGGNGESATAAEAIEKACAEIVTKSAGKLTHEAALAQVMDEKPELYARYREEQAELVASAR